MAQRIVRAVSITRADGEEVYQGGTVDLTDDEVARFEASGSLVPEGWESFDAYHTANQDAYRGGRGDTDASARALSLLREGAAGSITDISVPSGDNPFVALLTDDSPGVDETVALAEGDPAKAAQVLQAEEAVSGGSPRKGVVEGLAKITDEG